MSLAKGKSLQLGAVAKAAVGDSIARNAIVVTVIYVSLTVAGITTSSIGLLSETGTTDPGVMTGEPRPIRSDEILRWSPATLQALRADDPSRLATPFDFVPSLDRTDQRVLLTLSQAISLDGLAVHKVARALPIEMGFAAEWWRTSWMILILLPALLTLAGVRRAPAIAAAWLACLSAPTAWWSLAPLTPISYMTLSGVLAFASIRVAPDFRSSSLWRKVTALLLAVAAGLSAAQLPFSYQPWSIPVMGILGVFVLAALVSTPASRLTRATTVGAGTLVLVTTAIAMFVLQRDRYVTLAATVYPGQRRTSPATSPLALPWSGSTSWALQFHHFSDRLIALNQSEAAIGFTAAALVALGAIAVSFRRVGWSRWVPVASAGAAVIVFVSWVVLPWPRALLANNPLSLVPASRDIQILGPLTMILMCASASLLWRTRLGNIAKTVMMLSGMIAAWMMILDAERARSSVIPDYPQPAIFLVPIVIAVLVLLPFYYRRFMAFVPLLLLSSAFIVFVNPVMRGTGALTNASAAVAVREVNNSAHGRWATDGIFADALLIANAVPMLSGQQGVGPNESAWVTLDPESINKDFWNRAASYVTFTWTNDATPRFANPSADVIQVAVSPCSDALEKLDLKWIVSRADLDQSCLRLKSRIAWQGTSYNIYEVGTL